MPVYASFDAQTPYTTFDVMQRDADWINPGVLTDTDLQVLAQSPAAMSVTVNGSAQDSNGGNAWLPGGYRLNNDAVLALTVAAADASNPRIDLVVAGVDATQSPYNPEVKVITGTAAASPSVPATPTGYLALAQIAVAAGATSISQSNITDMRAIASLKAQKTIPQQSTPPTNASDGDLWIDDSATPNVLKRYDGSGWVTVGSVPSNASPAAAGLVEVVEAATTPVVPTRVASVQEVEITGTSAQNILTYTPQANNNFELNLSFRVVTGTTTVTITVTYTDAGGNETYYVLNAQSCSVGNYACVPFTFNAITSGVITVSVTASVANQVYVSGSLKAV